MNPFKSYVNAAGSSQSSVISCLFPTRLFSGFSQNYSANQKQKMFNHILQQLRLQRKNLLFLISLAVEKIMELKKENINDADPEFQNLLAVLQHIVGHQMAFTKYKIWWLDEKRMLWDFIVNICHNTDTRMALLNTHFIACVQMIESMNYHNTQAKIKSWLAIMLCDKKLPMFIEELLNNPNLLQDYYYDGAFLLSWEAKSLVHYLKKLTFLDITICLKDSICDIDETPSIDITPFINPLLVNKVQLELMGLYDDIHLRSSTLPIEHQYNLHTLSADKSDFLLRYFKQQQAYTNFDTLRHLLQNDKLVVPDALGVRKATIKLSNEQSVPINNICNEENDYPSSCAQNYAEVESGFGSESCGTGLTLQTNGSNGKNFKRDEGGSTPMLVDGDTNPWKVLFYQMQNMYKSMSQQKKTLEGLLNERDKEMSTLLRQNDILTCALKNYGIRNSLERDRIDGVINGLENLLIDIAEKKRDICFENHYSPSQIQPSPLSARSGKQCVEQAIEENYILPNSKTFMNLTEYENVNGIDTKPNDDKIPKNMVISDILPYCKHDKNFNFDDYEMSQSKKEITLNDPKQIHEKEGGVEDIKNRGEMMNFYGLVKERHPITTSFYNESGAPSYSSKASNITTQNYACNQTGKVLKKSNSFWDGSYQLCCTGPALAYGTISFEEPENQNITSQQNNEELKLVVENTEKNFTYDIPYYQASSFIDRKLQDVKNLYASHSI